MTKHDSKKHADHHHHGHTAAFNKEFKGIENWIKKFDDPERDKWQLPEKVIPLLSIQRGDVVADIGAGTGYFAIRIAKAFPESRILAADVEQEMLDYLKTQAKERSLPNLIPVKLDPTKPELPEKANLALIVDTLHHIEDRVSYLKNLNKCMAPHSRVAVIDFTKDSPEGPPADHRIPISEVMDELKSAGYTLDQDLKILPYQYFLIFKQE